MFNHLKTKLAAEWHVLVTGAEDDCTCVLEWIEQLFEKEYDMTLEEIGVALTDIKATLATWVAPTATDLTPVLTAIADLKTEVVSKVEGTPTVVTPPAA